jgi:hypothetical protein
MKVQRRIEEGWAKRERKERRKKERKDRRK